MADGGPDAVIRARFARHVLEATLTPEVRREWYRRLVDPDPKVGRTEMYRLSVLEEPPADVGPAVVEAVNVHVRNPNVDDPDLQGLLNNGVSALERFRPPGAAEALLAVAASRQRDNERGMAWAALSVVSADPAVLDRIAGHLRDLSHDQLVDVRGNLGGAGNERAADFC